MKLVNSRVVMDLFRVRTERTFDRWSVLVLGVYSVVLAFAIHHYQPFSDEAQEWLIARDCSLSQILLRRLHYEGHPPLWACFLWLLCRLHVPYAAINWISGAFALLGIYVLLRYSPFPRLFRWLLPFTYFLQYQYAAIARPYVLFPVLLFTLCILFTQRKPRLVLFAAVAGALANIGVHAGIIGTVFLALYAYELYRTRDDPARRIGHRTLAIAGGVFCLLGIWSAVVAFPAPDAVTAFKPNERVVAHPNDILRRLVPEETVSPTAPPLDRAMDHGSLGKESNRDLGTHYPAIVRFLVITTILAVGFGFYPISESNLLAIFVLLCLIRWLWRRDCLRLILPYVLVVLISAHLFVFDHHTGQFLLALVAAIWIALDLPVEDPMPKARLWIQPVFATVAAIVLLLQVGWSAHCIRSAALSPTDPGRQTAAFLTQNFAGKRVAGYSFESVSAQPYVDHNLYFNWPSAYWNWSINVNVNRRRTEVLEQHPDAVVVGDVTGGKDVVFDQWFQIAPRGNQPYLYLRQFWEAHGYHMTHQFCGTQFRRMGVSYMFCEDIMEPVNATTGS